MPKIPIVIQLFAPLGGTQEGSNIIDLPDAFSSGDSQNVWPDKVGRIRKINGYTAQNTAYTTDTGSSATLCPGIAFYASFGALGVITRQWVAIFDDGADEYEIATSTDLATWTFRKDLGTTPNGQIPDFAQFQNELFITDGVSIPQSWNGTSVSNAGGAQSPTPSGGSATGVTGNLLGQYEWKLVSKEDITTLHPGSAASTEVEVGVAGAGETRNLTWTADTDTDVVGYDLYRTTGTGKVFYFVTYINTRTTAAYTDNMSDERLLENHALDNHGDAPKTGVYFCEPHQQRMWWGRHDDEPRRVWYSDPGDGDSVNEFFNFLQFEDSESQTDVITGMSGNFEGTLVVWQENSIWRVSGTGEVLGLIADWNVWKTNAQVGTVSHRSVAKLPSGAVYYDADGRRQSTNKNSYAFFTPNMDIRIFDGENDMIISHPLQEYLSDVQYQYRHLICCQVDEVREQIYWYFPHGSSQTTNNKGLLYNWRTGVMVELSQTPFACAAIGTGSNSNQILVTGSPLTATGGLVYEQFIGTNYNGTGNDITAEFWTKPLYGVEYGQSGALPIPHKTKRYRWLDIITTALGSSQNLSIQWFAGHAATGATALGTVTMDMNGTNLTHIQDKILLKDSSGDYLTDQAMRLRFYDVADDSAWVIEGWSMGYQPLDKVRSWISR